MRRGIILTIIQLTVVLVIMFGIIINSNSANNGISFGGTGAATSEIANLTITSDKTIYIARNIEKTISVKVENNGEKDLTDVSLDLENFNKLFYAVSPSNIGSLKKGEIKTFNIDFLVPDYLTEQDFNYSLKTNEVSVKEPVKIVVLSISSYLKEEIDRLVSRIESVNSKLINDRLKEDIKKCENITDTIKLQISDGEIINADDNIKKADDCINSIENQNSPIGSIFSWLPQLPVLNTGDIFWIVTSAILIMLIFVIIFMIKKISNASKISSFMKSNEEKAEKPVTMDQKYFEDKLKNIHEKLGV